MVKPEDPQVKRIQAIIRETVSDAVCRLTSDGGTVVCTAPAASPVEIRFDLHGASYAELGGHAQQLRDKVTRANVAHRL